MAIDTDALVTQLSGIGIEILRARYNEASRRVVLELPSSEDAASFLNIVARYVPDSDPAYQRIFGAGGIDGSWEYFIRPVDVSFDQVNATELENLNWKPTKRFRLVVYLRFPSEDLPIVLGLIKDYSSQEG